MSQNAASRTQWGQEKQSGEAEAVFDAFAPLPEGTEATAPAPGPQGPDKYHKAAAGANIMLGVMGICDGEVTAARACVIAESAIKKVQAKAPRTDGGLRWRFTYTRIRHDTDERRPLRG